MWTLSDTRTRLTERLAESSTNFWSSDERDSVINEAQRRIAVITGGVVRSVTATVNGPPGEVTLPDSTIGPHSVAVNTSATGVMLPFVKRADIDPVWPDWRNASTSGDPKWAVLDVGRKRVFIIPTPLEDTEVGVNVAVMPATLESASDPLFDGVPEMQKYQGALLNLAACLALLKERYDGDAERFYAFYQQEMRDVGVDAGDLPDFSRQGGDA